MKTTIVLQNAYLKKDSMIRMNAKFPDGIPYELWFRLFARCQSGRRLSIMLGRLNDFTYCNTTPLWGVGSNSVLDPNPFYLSEQLSGSRMVVACGKQAEECVLNIWTGNIICIPHPACRVLTNALLMAAGITLREHKSEDRLRVAFRQLRGRFERENLP